MPKAEQDNPPVAADERPPEPMQRAVLLLSRSASGSGAERRLSRLERKRLLARRRSEAAAAIPAIDAVLARHGGRRLGSPTALGSLTVETTAAGIRRLQGTAGVKAVIEDQAIGPAG